MAILYGAKGGSAVTDLYTVDPTSGALTSIGPTGYAITGMDFHPTTGVLYAVTSNRSPGTTMRSLITINITTGAGTMIGSLGLTQPCTDCAFKSDGTLWGVSELDDDLYQIDLTTGHATRTGNSGISGYGWGLSFNSSDVCYLCMFDDSSLYTIDTSTGLATATGATLNGTNHDPVNACAFDSSDVLWALRNPTSGATPVPLLKISMSGVVTVVANTVAQFDAIAWSSGTGGGGGGGEVSKIKFGDGLSVTDEGSGIIRVDAGGGGGGGITSITSSDSSIDVTNPTGPTVDLQASIPDIAGLQWATFAIFRATNLYVPYGGLMSFDFDPTPYAYYPIGTPIAARDSTRHSLIHLVGSGTYHITGDFYFNVGPDHPVNVMWNPDTSSGSAFFGHSVIPNIPDFSGFSGHVCGSASAVVVGTSGVEFILSSASTLAVGQDCRCTLTIVKLGP